MGKIKSKKLKPIDDADCRQAALTEWLRKQIREACHAEAAMNGCCFTVGILGFVVADVTPRSEAFMPSWALLSDLTGRVLHDAISAAYQDMLASGIDFA